MSRTPDPFSSVSNPIDHSDWSGTETKQLDVSRSDDVVATLYRYLNGLDVDVDVNVVGTDAQDQAFNDGEDLRGGSAGQATLTVSTGSVDSDFVTEPWEFLRVEVTPATNPSSGEFELRAIDQGEVRL